MAPMEIAIKGLRSIDKQAVSELKVWKMRMDGGCEAVLIVEHA